MRIVSLLPSATDIVVALGLGDDVVGVTSSCDGPAGAEVVSRALLDGDGRTAAELDRAVSEAAAAGASVYGLDTEAVGRLRPDVIVTQDLCRVCAVPVGQVDEALAKLGTQADVISLDPASLADVLADVERIGRATGTQARAAALVEELRDRIEAVRARTAGRPVVTTFALEWLDPPFTAGHWVPDLVELAGGASLRGVAGTPSVRTTWEAVRATSPEALVAMPCGYGLPQAAAEARALLDVPELRLARVAAVDADRHFSRPGPGLVDGLEALAWVLHPDVVPEPPPGIVEVLRA